MRTGTRSSPARMAHEACGFGWARPSWPQEWFGLGLPAWAEQVVADELVAEGAVGTPLGSGLLLTAPTILAHGSDELKGRLLHPILTGEHTWCQLFSEPGAGSDLAGLTTRLTGRRRVRRQRAEGVEHQRAPCGLRHAARAPTGRRPSTAASVLRAADASAGGRGETVAPDERSRVRSTRCSSPTRGYQRRTSSAPKAMDGRSP